VTHLGTHRQYSTHENQNTRTRLSPEEPPAIDMQYLTRDKRRRI
jgi:hypothetical protein